MVKPLKFSVRAKWAFMTQTVPKLEHLTFHWNSGLGSPLLTLTKEGQAFLTAPLPTVCTHTCSWASRSLSCPPMPRARGSKLARSMPSQIADTGAPRAGLGMWLNGAGLVSQPCTRMGLLQLTLYRLILSTGGRVWPWMIYFQKYFWKAVINDLWDCFCKLSFSTKTAGIWTLEKMFFCKIWVSISINHKKAWTFWLRLTVHHSQ